MSPKIFWIGFVVLLLSISVGIQVVGLVMANSSPSFALEKDYERKAADWDSHRAQVALNQQLGWQIDPRFETLGMDRMALYLELKDREGLALAGASLRASAFHNARANSVQELNFTEAEPGIYRSELLLPRAGLWIFQCECERAGVRFVTEWRSSLDRPTGR